MVLVIKGKTCTGLFTLFNPNYNVSVSQPPHRLSIEGMAESIVSLSKASLFGLSLSGFSISSDNPITDWFGLI